MSAAIIEMQLAAKPSSETGWCRADVNDEGSWLGDAIARAAEHSR